MRNPALDFRPEPGSIPDAPGCYQFRDRHGRTIYVGKAKSLRSRLANYFAGWGTIASRTRAMLEAARSVDWIVVDTEVEALHLEYTLIQKHRPRYNIRYRDDKSYPYLVLTTSEEVPRAGVRRGRIKPDDKRFGPYAHAYAIRETLDLLLRVFPVRTCRQGTFDRAARTGRPCLLHHIDRCAAPCTGEVSVEEHRDLVDDLAATAREAVREATGSPGSVSIRVTHAYPDGCAPYVTVMAPGRRGEEVAQWDAVKRAVSEVIDAAGATITHHHAVGRDHAPWYARQTPTLHQRSLAAVKDVLDPRHVCNPGVLGLS